MRDGVRQLPLLLLAAMFVGAGGWRIVEAGTDDGWAAVSVGCLLLGSWLAVELHDRWHATQQDEPGSDPRT